VCFAAGLSTRGRQAGLRDLLDLSAAGYDQVVHDVASNRFRSCSRSIAPASSATDGPTHMGLYDIAYLRTLPGVTVMAPRNEGRGRARCWISALTLDAPAAIRYPRGSTSGKHDEPIAPVVLGPGRGAAPRQ